MLGSPMKAAHYEDDQFLIQITFKRIQPHFFQNYVYMVYRSKRIWFILYSLNKKNQREPGSGISSDMPHHSHRNAHLPQFVVHF